MITGDDACFHNRSQRPRGRVRCSWNHVTTRDDTAGPTEKVVVSGVVDQRGEDDYDCSHAVDARSRQGDGLFGQACGTRTSTRQLRCHLRRQRSGVVDAASARYGGRRRSGVARAERHRHHPGRTGLPGGQACRLVRFGAAGGRCALCEQRVGPALADARHGAAVRAPEASFRAWLPACPGLCAGGCRLRCGRAGGVGVPFTVGGPSVRGVGHRVRGHRVTRLGLLPGGGCRAWRHWAPAPSEPASHAETGPVADGLVAVPLRPNDRRQMNLSSEERLRTCPVAAGGLAEQGGGHA